MPDRSLWTALGLLLTFVIVLFGLAIYQSRAENNAVRVDANQGTKEAVRDKKSSEQASPKPGEPLLTFHQEDKAKTENAKEDTSEFWPAFLGYRLKITDSLLVLFTALLAWKTWGLNSATRGLQDAAAEQANITNKLFALDQRPWLNVHMTIDGKPIFNPDGSIDIRLHVFVKNIGKAPALNAANGFTGLHVGYEGAEEAFEAVQGFTKNRTESKGWAIFPNDEDTWDTTLHITVKDIERSNSITEGLPYHYFGVSYFYNSGFSTAFYETTRMYSFGIGFIGRALPCVWNEHQDSKIDMRLFKESVT